MNKELPRIDRLCEIAQIDPRTLPAGTRILGPYPHYPANGESFCYLDGPVPAPADGPRQIRLLDGRVTLDHDKAPAGFFRWQQAVFLNKKQVRDIFPDE